MLQAWPTRETLLRSFNPDQQAACAERGDRCFSGTAPTLYETRTAYGRTTAEAWLIIQLNDLSEFSGCREKLNRAQLDATAQTIILQFGFLKITELMVFFQRFKAGEYGRFYGAVDGLVITEALQEFMKYRADRLRRIENDRRVEADRERESKRQQQLKAGELLTREEWNEIGWLYNLGYER